MARPKESKNKVVLSTGNISINPNEAITEEEAKQNTDLKELIGGMQQIVGAVKDLTNRINKIENEVSVPKEAPKQEVKTAQITEDSVFPVPIDYRQAVEDKLNKKFKVRVEPNDRLPSFKFTIIVPQEYSPLKSEEFQEGEDRRTRIITIAEGMNGVIQWIEKVYNNFNVETRAKIQADRFNL